LVGMRLGPSRKESRPPLTQNLVTESWWPCLWILIDPFDSTCYRPRWTGKVKWLAAPHRFTFNVFHRWSFFAV